MNSAYSTVQFPEEGKEEKQESPTPSALKKSKGRQPDELTPKEIEVIKRYAKGMSVPDISKDLNLRISTIYQRLDRCKNRTGYESLAGLIHYAISKGWVTIGDAR